MSPTDKLIPFTKGASIPERVREARAVRATFYEHPLIKGTALPSWVVPSDVFGGNIDNLEGSYVRGLKGGRDRIEDRTKADNLVKKNMIGIATHAEQVAGGNIEVLHTFPFALRGIAQKKMPTVVVQPVVSLERGKEPNVLIAKVDRVTGITSFYFQINEVDPTDESQWKLVDAAKSYSLVIKGLQTGKNYWVRGACIGPKGIGPFSVPVSMISL